MTLVEPPLSVGYRSGMSGTSGIVAASQVAQNVTVKALLVSLWSNVHVNGDRMLGGERSSAFREAIDNFRVNLRQTDFFKTFMLAAEQCAIFLDLLVSVWLQMRRTGLTRLEKITYSALFLGVLGLAAFLVFG